MKHQWTSYLIMRLVRLQPSQPQSGRSRLRTYSSIQSGRMRLPTLFSKTEGANEQMFRLKNAENANGDEIKIDRHHFEQWMAMKIDLPHPKFNRVLDFGGILNRVLPRYGFISSCLGISDLPSGVPSFDPAFDLPAGAHRSMCNRRCPRSLSL
jgi:hypothetical protein